jgi:hypothetical protein
MRLPFTIDPDRRTRRLIITRGLASLAVGQPLSAAWLLFGPATKGRVRAAGDVVHLVSLARQVQTADPRRRTRKVAALGVTTAVTALDAWIAVRASRDRRQPTASWPIAP